MNWDEYFLSICCVIAGKSPCLSRQIGAILVRDHSIVSTGYNGPPRGVPHCGDIPAFTVPKSLAVMEALGDIKPGDVIKLSDKPKLITGCPRKAKGYKSGQAIDQCPAQHAEENAVSNAARIGASSIGTTLYLNTCIPCSKCFGTLINSGVVEIVAQQLTTYDELTQFLIKNSNISIRGFEID